MTLREILFKNLPLKLTAIFLAFFLWLGVRGDRDVERIVTVPLEIRIPRTMEITSDRPSFVDVTVRGTPTSMGFGPAVPLAYTIDLQTATEGPNTVALSPENVRLPTASGLEAIRVNPPRITLVLEKTLSKEVLVVVPEPEGKPAEGVDIYGYFPSPLSVLLTGPQSRVEPIMELKTEVVTLEGQDQSFDAFLNLIIEDDSLRTAPAGPIEVSFELGPHRELRQVTGIPIFLQDEQFTAQPEEISVTILVPITYQGELVPELFVATVSLDDWDPEAETAKLSPKVVFVDTIDPAMLIESIQPAEVTVIRRRN
jgi:hypothetical protein